jgi:hypothetical protein
MRVGTPSAIPRQHGFRSCDAKVLSRARESPVRAITVRKRNHNHYLLIAERDNRISSCGLLLT